MDDEYYLSGCDSENDENDENNKIIEIDFESIITLSNIPELKLDKKIQHIKNMINIFIKTNFSRKEGLIIHSIYNFNKNCLNERSKAIKELIVIIKILKIFNIDINQDLYNVLFDVPWKLESKKIKKLKLEVNEKFKFDEFKKTNKIITLDNSYTNNIYKLCSGYVFYIKSLMSQNEEFNILYNMIYNDCLFCENKNTKILINWLSNLIKNIIIFNDIQFFNTNKTIFKYSKPLNQQFDIFILIIFEIIEIINNNNNNKYSNKDKEKLFNFLIYNYKIFIPDLLKNKTFVILINNMLKNYFKKTPKCKKFIDIIIKNL